MRTKTVFSDISAIAHLWANQSQGEARTSSNNFYFSGDTIYSYGNHFPIATLNDNRAKDNTILAEGNKIVFFTLRSYSVITAKHISVVSQACRQFDRLYMYDIVSNNAINSPNDNDYRHETNIKHWIANIKNAFTKLATARKKEIHISTINIELAYLNRYIAYFGIKVGKDIKKLITSCNPEQFNAYMESESKRIKADQLKKQKQAKIEFLDSLNKFRSFEVNRLYNNNTGLDYLRYNTESNRFETSQDVEIPAKIGISFYENCIIAANCDCTQFMTYTVKEIVCSNENDLNNYVIIGCHKITLSEIKNAISDYNKATAKE